MLSIRAALKTALGDSFSVTHQAAPVTVNVAYAGKGDDTAMPCVYIQSEFGASEPSNIGSGADRHEAIVDLVIETIDYDVQDGSLLRVDIHAKIETLLRGVEKTLGSSYYAHIGSFQDSSKEQEGLIVYTRRLTVRGQSLESY